jgi:hypothetical protein
MGRLKACRVEQDGEDRSSHGVSSLMGMVYKYVYQI